MDDAKLKRWGWGAIIGLIGVILVAGLVVAISMSSPKPKATTTTASGEIATEDADKGDSKATEQKTDDDAAKRAAEEKAAAEKKAAEEKAAAEKKAAEEKAAANAKNQSNNSSNANMPKTGPLDTTVALLGASVVAYLAALNFGLLKKRA